MVFNQSFSLAIGNLNCPDSVSIPFPGWYFGTKHHFNDPRPKSLSHSKSNPSILIVICICFLRFISSTFGFSSYFCWYFWSMKHFGYIPTTVPSRSKRCRWVPSQADTSRAVVCLGIEPGSSKSGTRIWREIWVFPKILVPQNGWFIMENPIKIQKLNGTESQQTPKVCCDRTIRSSSLGVREKWVRPLEISWKYGKKKVNPPQ